MAKGVAYGRGVPLVAVPTLELLCVPVLLYREDIPDEALFVPMIDARRMEVYAAVYDRALHPLRAVQADIVEADTYKEWLDRGPVYFFGDGAAKCKAVLTHPNAHFLDNIQPLAKHMYPLAARALSRGETVDVAYFEPFYLKDFIATKPKDLL
jgi:tRNA threonylcarbamoyladenosine biosynthesis protein TsaB